MKKILRAVLATMHLLKIMIGLRRGLDLFANGVKLVSFQLNLDNL